MKHAFAASFVVSLLMVMGCSDQQHTAQPTTGQNITEGNSHVADTKSPSQPPPAAPAATATDKKQTQGDSEKSNKTSAEALADLAKMQGKWEITEQYFRGNQPSSMLAYPKNVMIKDNLLEFGDQSKDSLQLTLDPTKQPKQVEVYNSYQGAKMPGIYSLDADKLILIWGTVERKPPTSLKIDPDYFGWFIQLERQEMPAAK